MHIQVINFNLEGINRAEYEAVCNELAEAFAALPGLISKHWLADDENNTYGGVYIWESKDAYEGYLKSDLFAGVGANPALANIVSKDFDVIEGPTRVTRGLQRYTHIEPETQVARLDQTSISIYGSVSDELKQAMADFGPTYYEIISKANL